MKEQLLELLVPIAASVLSALLAAFFTWLKTKNVWLGKVIESAAEVAYQKQEVTLVKQLKSGEAKKLTYPEQSRVKGAAASDVASAVGSVLDTFVSCYDPRLGKAIEKANARAHRPTAAN